MRHTISVLVENKFGVLTRIAGLFSGRGYNIESLTVGPTNNRALSKMTIVTSGDDSILEQIDKQLNKLVEVLKVTDLTGAGFTARELILLKVKACGETRGEIIQIANIFRGSVTYVHHDALVVEVTGHTEKLDEFIELMEPFGIIEVARTGKVALARSAQPTENLEELPEKT